MDVQHLITRARKIYAIDVVYRAAQDYTEQHGSVYAAAISYYMMFALFPMMILVATIFGWISRGSDLQHRVINAIVNQLPPYAGIRPQVENVVKISATQGGLLGLISFVGALWIAANLFSALRKALNVAFDVPTARPFITGRIFDVLTALGVVILAMLSLGATAALGILRAVSTDFFKGPLINLAWGAVFFFLPFVLSYCVFIMIYRLIPNRRIHPRALQIGALLAALGFELVKVGFTIYLANFASYQRVYGALAGVIAFLVFVYLESTIVILAAEIASELSKDLGLQVETIEQSRQMSPAP